MKITSDIINKIFSNKLKLTKKSDIVTLSNYDNMIPMFDIYSMKIYPIENINIHFRMVDCHYRFINKELFDWMNNIVKKKKNNYMIVKQNLEILKSYDITILYETSVNTFFKYSPKFGLEISICKRNSFNPKMKHITPYYSKKELLKLGKNMKLIKDSSNYDLLDQDTHYKICKQISKNDISVDTILQHSQYIIKKKMVQLIMYYSLNGSFLMNKLLRDFSTESKYYNPQQVTNIKDLVGLINKAPALPKDFYFYRFIWEDDFLVKLKIGEHFTDNGFTSTTRDPFYSPGTNYNFGLVLLKINIPKDVKGVGLFIENFSLFPIEEEFLLGPGNKLKLIGKDNNFKYHHLNPKFERLVTKKYEFVWDGKDTKIINKINNLPKNNISIPLINQNTKVEGDTIIERLEFIVKNFSSHFNLTINKYKLTLHWFDGTSSYKDFYYNNTTKGLVINLVEDNIIVTSIECGGEMVVNYLLTKVYNDNSTRKELELYHIIAKLIGYEYFIIYDTFHHIKLSPNDDENIFRINQKYNVDLAEYIKNKSFKNVKYGERSIGSLKMKLIFNKKNNDLNKKYGNSMNLTLGELYQYMIKNNYYYLEKINKYLLDEYQDAIYTTRINSKSYWEDMNETFESFMNVSSKEELYDTSFNRRRTRQ